MNYTMKFWKMLFTILVFLYISVTTHLYAADTKACLITKTDSNPFFVTMKEGAVKKSEELDVDLQYYAGGYDGDHEAQAIAVRECIANGVDGILITASDTSSITPFVSEAREKGILVFALDAPLEPIEAADATFATDNFLAGKLIGQWARAAMGSNATDAKIAMLNISKNQPTVGVLRSQGFLDGFGIDLRNPAKWGDEIDSRIVGHGVTQGSEDGGFKAMNTLIQKSKDINLVYTINEPAAVGAYQALKKAGLEKNVLIVSVDGGCDGVNNVRNGIINATAQQYPLLMASFAIEAIKDYAENEIIPELEPTNNFFNTGVILITDEPTDGINSVDSSIASSLCWGGS